MTEAEIEDLKYVLRVLESWRDNARSELVKKHYTTAVNYMREAISRQWKWPKHLRQYQYLSFDVKGNSRAWTEKPNLVHVGNDLVFCGPSYVFVDVEPPPQAVLPALIANPELVEDIP